VPPTPLQAGTLVLSARIARGALQLASRPAVSSDSQIILKCVGDET
jgi:hypothetical protein